MKGFIKKISVLILLLFYFIGFDFVAALPVIPIPGNLLKKKDLYFGGYGGINFSFPGIQKSYDVLNQAGLALPGVKSYDRFINNMGFQMGVVAYLKLYDHLAISILPGVARYSFHYSITNDWSDNNTVYTDNYLFADRYWTIAFPFQLYYILNPDNKVNFYGTIGAKYEYIFHAVKGVSYSETIMVNNQEKGKYFDSFKSQSNRMFKRSDLESLVGVGISYQFTHFIIFTELDLVKGWNGITKNNNRYKDPRNLYTYPDIQDDLNSNNLALNIVILYKLFQAPKKLKCVTP